MKKTRKNTGEMRMLMYIWKNYRLEWFTSELLYSNSDRFGLSSSSVGSALTSLRKKGFLQSQYARQSDYGHDMYYWRVIKLPDWLSDEMDFVENEWGD